jgi:hypothetical protein
MGLSVIPCCWPTPDGRCGCGRGHKDREIGKVPLVKWEPYQKAPAHPDQVDAWWRRWPRANVGCVTGAVSGVDVLDADGPTGLESLKSLGTPATTWVARTGRDTGGLHVYVRHTPGIGNSTKVLPGLDVRGEGGYAIAPPSRHRLGRAYEWLTPPDKMDLAEMPAGLLVLAANGADRVSPIVREGQRNDTLYRMARSMVANGCAANMVRLRLQDQNTARCQPPLTEREVCEIADHAITQRNRPDFQVAPPDAPVNDPPSRPLGRGLGEFLSTEFPAAEHLIEGVLSEDGGGWIAGEEKTLKTFYALEEALCIASGWPVCGRFKVTRPRRVLFIEEEDPARRTYNRLRALLRGHGRDPDDPAVRADLDAWFKIDVWSGFSLDSQPQIDALDATCKEFGPAVVYIDVLRKVTARDLNKAHEAGAVLAVLDDLRRKYGVVFRVLHHYRKTQGYRPGRGSQEIGGSFVLGAWAENSLFFEPVGRNHGIVRVTVQSKDAPPAPPFSLRLVAEGPAYAPTTVRLIADDVTTESAEELLIEQVVEVLPKLPTVEPIKDKPGVPLSAIVTALHRKSDKPVRAALKSAKAEKRVEVVGTGAKNADLWAVIGS